MGELGTRPADGGVRIAELVLDGLSTREASTLLGVHPGTVKTRLHRAKAQLRCELISPRGSRSRAGRDGLIGDA